MPGSSQLLRCVIVSVGVLVGGAMGAAACGPATLFECSDDTDCSSGGISGRCEDNDLCSFPSDDCTSGWAYGSLAGSVAGECTPPSQDTDVDTTGTSGTTVSTLDDSGGSTVGGDNTPPVAVDDAASTFVDTPINVPVLANDEDFDGDTLTISEVTQPGSGAVSIEGSEVIYTPAMEFSGVETFAYTVDDGNGGTALGGVEVTVQGTCATWNAAWSNRAALRFDNVFDETIPPEDLVDVPVLVQLESSLVAQLDLQPEGADLRFVDSDDATLLPHEIERWDPSGTSFVWVAVPSIDAASADDFIWMYHGNATAQDGQQAPEVWSNGFVAVWHMAQEPDPDQGVHDSTGRGHDGAIANHGGGVLLQNGLAGGALDLSTSERVEVPDHDDFDPTEALTLEAWLRPDVVDDAAGRYAINKSSAYFIHTMRTYTSVTAFFAFLGPPVSAYENTPGGATLEAGEWTYLAGTFRSEEQVLRLFHDAVLLASEDLAAQGLGVAPLRPNDEIITLGSGHDGLFDEARISSVQRSHAWLAAQQRSMLGDFVTFGPSTVVCP